MILESLYTVERLVVTLSKLPDTDIELLDNEIFVDISVNSAYKISNYGRVISYKHTKPKLKTGRSIINGHPYISLSFQGKPKFFSVRRLVADAFIDNPKALEYVYSKDGTTTTAEADKLYRVDSNDHMAKMGKISSHKKQRKIRCVETGEIFESMTVAANHYSMSVGYFNNYMRNPPIHSSKTNLHFEYYESAESPRLFYTPCICNETGVQYQSIKAAAKDLGLSEKQVNRAVNKGGLVQGKYSFRKVDSSDD